MKSLLALVLVVLLTGCATEHQKGGTSTVRSSTGASASIVQSEDPKQPSVQASKHTQERRWVIPMGSIVKRTTVNGTNTYIEEILLNADTIENANSADSFDNRLGGAQPNTAMEIAAKLKAAWPIMLVGIALLIGSGALFYFGWYTKGVIALGLAITAFCLYYVIPQHAGAIALGALGLFALLSALVLYVHYGTKLDQNRNWIPDALEGKKGKVAVDTTTHVEGETK